MSLLEVSNLTRDFDGFRAVSDVSFQVEEGSILGFIGPNGAGKTTTLRILATLDLPTWGDVRLDGKSLILEPERARPLIGYMPDRYGTYEDLTVRELLDFFARAYRLTGTARRERVDSVMAFTQLDALADRLSSALSKGMKQRVALARTLLNDPRLLILDEPADGLDPRARIELRELLRALAEQGKTILISSHILTELSEMCDACAIIEQGRLLAHGPVDAILEVGPEAKEATLELRVAGGGADALTRTERFLLEQPKVRGVEPHGERLRVKVSHPGKQPELELLAAELLRALVGAGIPVCAFELHRADLEDAFMSVTRGRVA